jgi:hypothetical protein
MDSYDAAVHAALVAVGLPGLRVVADAAGIAALERTPGCRVPFGEALRQALEAFLGDGGGSDGRGRDSALAVVRGAPEAFGLGPEPTDAEMSAALHRILADDPQAQIVLLTAATLAQPAYRFLPEYGESPEAQWVFRIIAPASWPLLQWAIVDPRGERAAYSYEFD